jgi:hypothetical protein
MLKKRRQATAFVLFAILNVVIKFLTSRIIFLLGTKKEGNKIWNILFVPSDFPEKGSLCNG